MTPPATTQPAVQRILQSPRGMPTSHPIISPFLFGNTQTTLLPSPVISYYPLFSNNYSIFLYRNIFPKEKKLVGGYRVVGPMVTVQGVEFRDAASSGFTGVKRRQEGWCSPAGWQ